MKRSLTVKQVSEQTGYTEEWVRRLLRQGKLIGSKRKDHWLVMTNSLTNYLNHLPPGERRGRKPKGGKQRDKIQKA